MTILRSAITVFLVVAMALSVPPAVAMNVSDLTSYSYYVKQIGEAQKLLGEVQKQVDTLDGIKDKAEKTQKAVSGNYGRGVGLVSDLQRIRKKLESTPTTMQGTAKKWLSLGNDGLEIGEDGFISVGKVLDDNWIDPRDPRRNKDRLAKLDQIYQVKQASLRNNIEASDEILRNMPARLKTIEDLVEQIDQTDGIKDAQDLTNRFLAEILKVLAEMSAIAARVGESYALLNYKGVSEATMQQRMQAQSSAPREGWAARDLRKKGYDPQNMSGKDFRKILNAEE